MGAAKPAMFLRLIALGPGCEPHGGAAPTIELRAGKGALTTVPPATEDEPPPPITDEFGTLVGTATWTRELRDVFLVRLEINDLNERMWRVQITNTISRELGFVWVTSDLDEDTLQPRLSMERSHGRSALAGNPMADIVVGVANVGTGVLHFITPAGTDMGGGFLLDERPDSIPPNDCGRLVIKVEPIPSVPFNAPDPPAIDFTLKCDTRDAEDRTLHLARSRKTGKEKLEKEKEFKEKEKEQKEKENKDSPHELQMVPDDFPLGVGPLLGWATHGVTDRWAGLGEAASKLVHFIRPELRPDLSAGALTAEDETS
ncbi:hypothetical protein ACFQ9H_16140 [Streptomyces sp. NPDC056517]|uniref:hypothetical protein n=1 Tax=Streptomyces sp. NPDC056517 TaxID=3345848 RepID=UPI0036782490